MDRDDFDNVSWHNDRASDSPQPNPRRVSGEEEFISTHDSNGKNVSGRTGRNAAEAMDLACIGDGRLDCTVSSPQKENDGTKDAFVSYLVSTQVSSLSLICPIVLFL